MPNALGRKTPLAIKFVAVLMVTLSVLVIFAATAEAKKKEKPLLPDLVWKAESVLVVILPGGESVDDPLGNQKAKEEVEKAFMKWGRYRLAVEKTTADLVIGVKKGTSKLASPTISGGGVDQHPGTIETTDNSVRIGVQQGRPPAVSQDDSTGGPVHTGVQAGAENDTFEVFLGGPNVAYPVDNAPVWKLTAKDALKPPRVAAVDEFRKAVEEAEKAAANRPQPQQKQQQGQQPGQKNP